MPRPYGAVMPKVNPLGLYSIRFVSKKFEVNRATVYRYMQKGLQTVKKGSRTKIYGHELIRFWKEISSNNFVMYSRLNKVKNFIQDTFDESSTMEYVALLQEIAEWCTEESERLELAPEYAVSDDE